MEETTEHDEAATDPTNNDPGDDDPGSAPGSQPAPDQDEQGKEHALQFDPQEIENDPSRNPPIDELNDLKGG